MVENKIPIIYYPRVNIWLATEICARIIFPPRISNRRNAQKGKISPPPLHSKTTASSPPWKLQKMALSTISKLNNANICPANSSKSIYHDSGTHYRNALPRVRIQAAAQSTGGGLAAEFEEGQLERPKWTGETPLSRLVGALISFKPLYSVMKLGARQVLIRWNSRVSEIFYCFNNTIFNLHLILFSVIIQIYEIWGLNLDSTAEKTNIPWRDMTKEILESNVYKEKDAIEDSSVVYPDCNFFNPINTCVFQFYCIH